MVIEPRSESLRAFLEGILDYAGLFPPASLSLEQARRNFSRYLGGADHWILRSFVCPADRLSELTVFEPPAGSGPAPEITVLGPAAANEEEWRTACETAFDGAAEYERKTAGNEMVAAFEMKIPSAVASARTSLERGLAFLLERAADRTAADYFIEVVPPADDPATLAHRVAEVRAKYAPVGLGLKIRTGGVTPKQIPPASDVARFIIACRDHGVPFKATAGLHHPLFHFSRQVGASMHGFLNVFVGSMAAHANALDAEELEKLLVLSEPPMSWDDDGVNFGPHRVTTDQIRRLRKSFVVSFGSCSFDEPREDLLELGLVQIAE